MPLRSPKMYSFIFGFQRLVWCPKWTPASSNSFMVMLANQPPRLVCIGSVKLIPLLPIAIPVPALSGTGRIEHLKIVVRPWSSVVSPTAVINGQRRATNDRSLALAVLEALSRALLTVLLAFFRARIAADHAFGLQLLAQLNIKDHEGAGNAELYRVGLAIHAAAGNSGNHIEAARGLSRDQGLFRAHPLRLSNEILLKGTSVDLELPAARAQVNARDGPLAASGTVILN